MGSSLARGKWIEANGAVETAKKKLSSLARGKWIEAIKSWETQTRQQKSSLARGKWIEAHDTCYGDGNCDVFPRKREVD